MMKADDILKFLNAVGIPNGNRYKRTGNIISRCPLGPWRHEGGQSSPEVFGVKIENGDPQCNCFACDYRGTLGKLLQRLKGLDVVNHKIDIDWGTAAQVVFDAEITSDFDFNIPGIEEVLSSNKNALHEFPDWWLEGFPDGTGVGWAREYLKMRGMTKSVAAKMDVRCDPSEQRVCFPVRDFQGVLRGLHGRALDPGVEPRYRMYPQAKRTNPVVWLGEHWVDTEKPIVVVEGPFDLASVLRVYPNAVSPLFANPGAVKVKRMSDALEWVTLLDRGAGGDTGREKINKALGKDHVLKHLHPPTGRKDPGEMSKEELVELLSPHVPIIALSA
jgi:hypothetical protein